MSSYPAGSWDEVFGALGGSGVKWPRPQSKKNDLGRSRREREADLTGVIVLPADTMSWTPLEAKIGVGLRRRCPSHRLGELKGATPACSTLVGGSCRQATRVGPCQCGPGGSSCAPDSGGMKPGSGERANHSTGFWRAGRGGHRAHHRGARGGVDGVCNSFYTHIPLTTLQPSRQGA